MSGLLRPSRRSWPSIARMRSATLGDNPQRRQHRDQCDCGHRFGSGLPKPVLNATPSAAHKVEKIFRSGNGCAATVARFTTEIRTPL